MRILIVDDILLNAILLQEIIADTHETVITQSGLDALKLLTNQKFDLVLLDIMMPDMDGYETLKEIRCNPRTENIIVIMVTAKTERDDLKKAIDLGANDYIKKPIDSVELISKIDFYEKLATDYKKIEQYQVYANINESMMLAQRFQTCLSPDKNTFKSIFPESLIINKPRDFVSGDFYYINQFENKKIMILFDCVGHGVPAALFTVFIHCSLRMIIGKFKIFDTVEIAQSLNSEISQSLQQSNDMYSSLSSLDAAITIFDTSTNILEFVGAHRPLVIVRNSNEKLDTESICKENINNPENSKNLYVIDGDLNPLGLENQYYSYQKKSIKMLQNDKIYLFSDGFIDQTNETYQQRFSKKKFYNLLFDTSDLPMSEQRLAIYSELKVWMGDTKQSDDILLIGFEIN